MWTRRFSSSSRLQKMCLSRWIRRNPVHWKGGAVYALTWAEIKMLHQQLVSAGRLWRNTSSLFGMAKTLNTLGEHSVREDYTKCNYWIQVFSLSMLSSCCFPKFLCLFPKKNLRCRTYTSPSFQSPSDTVIEVQLAMFTRGVVVDGCELAGVEIKTNEDQTRTGYR